MTPKLLIISRYLPEDVTVASDNNDNKHNDNNNNDNKHNDNTSVQIDATAQRNDQLDDFNHPRYRRARILQALQHELLRSRPDPANNYADIDADTEKVTTVEINFQRPDRPSGDLKAYETVQSADLMNFLDTAWDRWDALGPEGQDPASSLPNGNSSTSSTSTCRTSTTNGTRPLIPGNVPLPRDSHQRPSKNVMGQVGYYCTDTCTPIFQELREELQWDAAVMQAAVTTAATVPQSSSVIYALATHPGHHAAYDSFGGYCYLNHAAFCARALQQQLPTTTMTTTTTPPHAPATILKKVAVLDIDYHCGNGTASIFYHDPSVLVVSIHCHPDWEYPFHSGFEDDTGTGEGEGATLHLPLLPGTKWKEYNVALERAMKAIRAFGAQALVVSMGLDTLHRDPCAIRRAGFGLTTESGDFHELGQRIGSYCPKIPIIVIQEGGYQMDEVPQAATDVLLACVSSKTS